MVQKLILAYVPVVLHAINGCSIVRDIILTPIHVYGVHFAQNELLEVMDSVVLERWG